MKHQAVSTDSVICPYCEEILGVYPDDFMEGEKFQQQGTLEHPIIYVCERCCKSFRISLRKTVVINTVGVEYDKDSIKLCSQEPELLIVKNRARCKKCGTILESRSVHDFKTCSCGAMSVDGGHEYIRRLGNPDDIEEMSVTQPVEQ